MIHSYFLIVFFFLIQIKHEILTDVQIILVPERQIFPTNPSSVWLIQAVSSIMYNLYTHKVDRWTLTGRIWFLYRICWKKQ